MLTLRSDSTDIQPSILLPHASEARYIPIIPITFKT